MKAVGKFLLNFLIYVAIVGGVVWGMPKFLSWYLDTPYPMAAITSGSMWPALKEGDLIFIQSVAKEELKKGDIVVYRNKDNNTFTIHRIVSLDEETFTTKGDANFTEDKPIFYEDLVGRTYMLFDKHVHIPYLGSITVFASNWAAQRETK